MSAASFLENHDQPRFQSLTQDQSLVKNAIAWTFVNDGIPILYYGQEQGYTGSNDPNNREALWLSGYVTTDKPLVTHISILNKARKAAISSCPSFLSTPLQILNSNANSLTLWKPPLLAFLTNVGNASVSSWVVPNAHFAPNAPLVEVLSCASMTADGNGGVAAQTTSGQPMVILPASVVAGTDIC